LYTEQNYQKFKNANSNIQIHLKTSSVLLKKAKKQNVASKKQNLKNWRSKKASFCFLKQVRSKKAKSKKARSSSVAF
jgi:GH24 family phage-related lysozyme (muramidase)